MEFTTLGRTELKVSRTGFGALPIQRVDFATADKLLKRAFDAGINFFDTARFYSDSEAKIGVSLSGVRDKIILATKCSGAQNRQEVLNLLTESLKQLKTDYVDLLQLHTPKDLPDPDDPESTYAGLLEAQKKGMTRFIGMTNHSRQVAEEAVLSGLYDTLQFPLSAISSEEDFTLADLCAEKNLGFIAMKGMCGGILSNSLTAFTALRSRKHVIPIWGVQKMEELEEFLALEETPPEINEKIRAEIEKDKAELAGGFCRSCGYCLPCPAEIPIPMAARMGLLVRRMPSEQFKSEHWQSEMNKIEDCRECGACLKRCPYGLDTPELLKKHLKEYREFLNG